MRNYLINCQNQVLNALSSYKYWLVIYNISYFYTSSGTNIETAWGIVENKNKNYGT
jgi:hypothetical protein